MTPSMLLTTFCSALLAGRLAGETPSSDVIELPDHERISVSAYRAGCADAEKDQRWLGSISLDELFSMFVGAAVCHAVPNLRS
jgi:hypothetical protein